MNFTSGYMIGLINIQILLQGKLQVKEYSNISVQAKTRRLFVMLVFYCVIMIVSTVTTVFFSVLQHAKENAQEFFSKVITIYYHV